MTFMICISSPFKTFKQIKNQNVIASMTREYVSSQLILGFQEKGYATNRILYLMISFFLLRFLIKTHLYPIDLTSICVQTIGPNIFCFFNKFSSYQITFHFCQSFLHRHSSTTFSSGFSSFFMMLIATSKENIVYNECILISFFSCMQITNRDLLF